MGKKFKVRDLRKKNQYKVDDAYLNGYAKVCGIYATAVYNSLSRHADFETQECWPSIDLIAQQHNISRPSVIKGIKALEKWGVIIKSQERDDKTQRQKNNIYGLVDKSDWIPLPKDSRVNHVDTEPSKPQSGAESTSEQSRVNHVDWKDNTLKDNTVEGITEQSSEFISPHNKHLIPDIIREFESINPAAKTFYSRNPQRRAVQELLDLHGFEKLVSVINNTLTKTNKLPYFPTITTPIHLRDKWSQLEAAIIKHRNEIKLKTAKVGNVYW